LAVPIALAAIFPANTAQGQQALRNPSDDTVCLFYYHFATQPPRVSQFAQTARAVRDTDEFNRPKAQRHETHTFSGLISDLHD
jgi:hypothetical protein